jgi:hypothetical protein
MVLVLITFIVRWPSVVTHSPKKPENINSSKINISDQYVKRILEKIVLNEEGKNHYM